MSRYFKIIEISGDTFFDKTGYLCDGLQLTVPVDEAVFVGVDDDYKTELNIDLNFFDN